jgi:alpha-amylase
VFRNTELLYDNGLVDALADLPFHAILAEGSSEAYNPNYLFRAIGEENDLKVILRNFELSDDIAFRYSDTQWEGFPLEADKYLKWIEGSRGDFNNIFLDYETFGEHHSEETGIFTFFRDLVELALSRGSLFSTCTDLLQKNRSIGFYDCFGVSSWADQAKDITAWRGNSMQFEALNKCYQLEEPVKNSRRRDLLEIWSRLQTSDHFYYLATKGSQDDAVHDYFSPFNTPYEAYIYYMNVLSDLELTVSAAQHEEIPQQRVLAG